MLFTSTPFFIRGEKRRGKEKEERTWNSATDRIWSSQKKKRSHAFLFRGGGGKKGKGGRLLPGQAAEGEKGLEEKRGMHDWEPFLFPTGGRKGKGTAPTCICPALGRKEEVQIRKSVDMTDGPSYSSFFCKAEREKEGKGKRKGSMRARRVMPCPLGPEDVLGEGGGKDSRLNYGKIGEASSSPLLGFGNR